MNMRQVYYFLSDPSKRSYLGSHIRSHIFQCTILFSSDHRNLLHLNLKERMSSAPSKTIITGSFLGGFAVASFLRYLDKKRISGRNRQNAGAFPEGNDSSMFWGDVNELTKVPQKNKFLPAELYGQMIRDTIGCCVDALVVR